MIKNGQSNGAVITVRNDADGFLDLVSVGASFHDPKNNWKLIRNVSEELNQTHPEAGNGVNNKGHTLEGRKISLEADADLHGTPSLGLCRRQPRHSRTRGSPHMST